MTDVLENQSAYLASFRVVAPHNQGMSQAAIARQVGIGRTSMRWVLQAARSQDAG